jgi:hypothetical protein
MMTYVADSPPVHVDPSASGQGQRPPETVRQVQRPAPRHPVATRAAGTELCPGALEAVVELGADVRFLSHHRDLLLEHLVVFDDSILGL